MDLSVLRAIFQGSSPKIADLQLTTNKIHQHHASDEVLCTCRPCMWAELMVYSQTPKKDLYQY